MFDKLKESRQNSLTLRLDRDRIGEVIKKHDFKPLFFAKIPLIMILLAPLNRIMLSQPEVSHFATFMNYPLMIFLFLLSILHYLSYATLNQRFERTWKISALLNHDDRKELMLNIFMYNIPRKYPYLERLQWISLVAFVFFFYESALFLYPTHQTLSLLMLSSLSVFITMKSLEYLRFYRLYSKIKNFNLKL